MIEGGIRMPSAVLDRLARDGIPADRVRGLIRAAEESGVKFRAGENYCASQTLGAITLWAVYHPVPGGLEVTGVYHHRMRLMMEEDTDV